MEPTCFDSYKEALVKQLTTYMEVIKETGQYDAANINIFLKITDAHTKAATANADYLNYTLRLFNQHRKSKKPGQMPTDLLFDIS